MSLTREEYKKHKECFNWFMEQPKNTEIWVKDVLNVWSLTAQPTWGMTSDYVINDEYYEFRKALVDGRTIQYYVDGFAGWQDTTDFNNPMEGAGNYRIKPEEPNFKVGDWVIETLMNKEKIYQVKELDIKDILAPGYCGDVKLWEPKKDEIVWCWDDNMTKTAHIGKYSSYMQCTNRHRITTDMGCDYYDNIEPFIDKLPTILSKI